MDSRGLTYWRDRDIMATFTLRCNRFEWINVVSPTTADIQGLRKAHREISELHLEDLLSQTERPKVDEEDNYLFVVIHFPRWDPNQRVSRLSEVEFIIGRSYLITVHDGTLKPLVRLFARCELYENERNAVIGKGANDAFYVILDKMVDYLFPILAKVEAHIHEIEDNLFARDARTVIQQIAEQRRDIIVLRRIIRHLVPVVETVARTEHSIIREDLEEYFGDTVDHLYAARDIIDENFEIINSVAETADTLLSHRINEVMRVLTVISVIMLPLTLISGIYGMNIGLPLQEHPNAFIVVAVSMIAVATLMLAYFRTRNWI